MLDKVAKTRLTDEQVEWQMKARKFAEEEIRPLSLKRDQIMDPAETFDWEIIRKGSRLGFRTAAVPKEYGGPEIDCVTQVLVMAELAKGDAAISKTFTQCWKWSQTIARICTPEQKERFLRPFMEDETFLLAKAGTEPDAGSDNRMLATEPNAGWMMSAVRDGDEWVLNGRKRYIANGSVAKLYIIATRTDPSVGLGEGTTMFLVPRETPGFRVGKIYDKIGWRFYQNAELILENVRVPHANILGGVNSTVKAMGGHTNEFGDWELGAHALGVCDAAIEMATAYAKSRWQGGKYIIEHQAIQLLLSEMHMLTEALRAFVMQTAMNVDLQGEVDPKHKSLLMNFAAEVVQKVAHSNMNIHGGAGVMRDIGAEKLYRDAAIWTHLAADSVQRLRVAKYF